MARDITKLHPKLQDKIKLLKAECEKQGFPLLITSCIRNEYEQLDCYKRKTSTLKYPNSMHNWGVAVDFCRNVKGREYDNSDKFFDKVGSIAKKLELIWGGDFSHPDKPHLQLCDWGKTTSKLKTMYSTPNSFMSEYRALSPTIKDNQSKSKILTVITKQSNLNVRSYANGDIIGKFKKNTKLELLDDSNKQWYKVKGKAINEKIITGYCSSQYLK